MAYNHMGQLIMGGPDHQKAQDLSASRNGETSQAIHDPREAELQQRLREAGLVDPEAPDNLNGNFNEDLIKRAARNRR